jgi:serine/threonine protein kinase
MALTMPGSRVGPYEIEALIGRGGMGEVYRARDPRLGRPAAVKLLAPGLLSGARQIARFSREVRTGALINHPNIATVYDVGTHDGMPFVVSELLHGETLRTRLNGGGLPAPVVFNYGRQIASGLVAAHQLGVVHSDLKPENIFLAGETVKILDFGIAKCRQDALEGLQDTLVATWPDMLLGTVGYMSPEQIRGLAPDQRTDLFSVGVMLYEMLAGIAPFRGDSPIETLGAILKEEPRRLLQHCDAPPELERIIRHCLEKDREYRFQSARDLLFNLDLAASSPPPQARRAGPFEAREILSGLVASWLR